MVIALHGEILDSAAKKEKVESWSFMEGKKK